MKGGKQQYDVKMPVGQGLSQLILKERKKMNNVADVFLSKIDRLSRRFYLVDTLVNVVLSKIATEGTAKACHGSNWKCAADYCDYEFLCRKCGWDGSQNRYYYAGYLVVTYSTNPYCTNTYTCTQCGAQSQCFYQWTSDLC